ncbi:unnamed protein product [Ilex paraguariensis]|uniref:Molybdate transporter 1 n=1 Tax=Ilex paraguariensis TaxID=185542 RepID=A0ABC8TB08_9AQUA
MESQLHHNPPCVTIENPLETATCAPTTSIPQPNILQNMKNNLVFSSKWAELNGAMGDLGTYIPIVLALTLAKDLNLGTILIFTGVYNIVTGAIYGVPMPVQPMKSIAAVAITDPDFGVPEAMAAGICIVGILFVLGITDDENEARERNCDLSDEESVGRRRKLRKIIVSLPSAFIIFFLGVVLAILRGPKVVKGFKFEPSSIEIVKISKHSWKEGFVRGTVPQLSLSVLNSVIAVCKLSTDLFPGKDTSATSISVTVGGLAGQYKFRGRSGGCVALLGAAKLVLGLVLGSSLVKVLNQFLVGVLGVLFLFAGIELAICSRDMNSKEESFVMLLCTAISLVGSSAALGFICGIVAHLFLRLRNWGHDQSCSTLWVHGNP